MSNQPKTAAEQDEDRKAAERAAHVGGFQLDAKNVGALLVSASAIAPTFVEQVQSRSWGNVAGLVLGFLASVLSGNMKNKQRRHPK